jgi:hypothetical protein
MSRADEAFALLGLEDEREYTADFFSFELEPRIRLVEGELGIESGGVDLLFAEEPTAATFARSLGTIDREARRVATGLEEVGSPDWAWGRYIMPTKRGLRVERADPGSLHVLLALGGLYKIVTSQPLSFALNLGAMLGYARAAVRALGPGHRRTREVTIGLPRRADDWRVRVPADYPTVRIRLTSSDGSSIEVECERD